MALGFILAGICGNLYDRLGLPGLIWIAPDPREGLPVYAVRDWLHFEIQSIGFNWAVFNLADSMLVVGGLHVVPARITSRTQPTVGRRSRKTNRLTRSPLVFRRLVAATTGRISFRSHRLCLTRRIRKGNILSRFPRRLRFTKLHRRRANGSNLTVERFESSSFFLLRQGRKEVRPCTRPLCRHPASATARFAVCHDFDRGGQLSVRWILAQSSNRHGKTAGQFVSSRPDTAEMALVVNWPAVAIGKASSMKISRTVGYALQATLQLAEADPGTPIPCSKLAAKGGMPERFLLQILRNLVNAGILQSTRGVEGGYSLERPPEQISLLDLIEAVDGPLEPEPPLTEGLPEESLRHLSSALRSVTDTARRQLADIKITELAARRRK